MPKCPKCGFEEETKPYVPDFKQCQPEIDKVRDMLNAMWFQASEENLKPTKESLQNFLTKMGQALPSLNDAMQELYISALKQEKEIPFTVLQYERKKDEQKA